ncbi:hypothetical protein [Polaromonas sp.]|uniref:hypothetical protein n=1 Tax=Polaromonas sp. TaxID=1869339 RepID=UPI00352BAC56
MTTSPALKIAIAALESAEKKFLTAELSPLAHGRAREAAIVAGIEAIAASYGLNLRLPLSIDSRGDISIIAIPDPGNDRKGFGKDFADLLTLHQVRCGQFPGAHLLPENCWGFLNHFAAEKLVRHVAELQDVLAPAELNEQASERPTM